MIASAAARRTVAAGLLLLPIGTTRAAPDPARPVASSVVSSAEAGQCLTRTPNMPRNTHWMPPLDRVLTLNTADLTLRDALERVAQTARIQLTYSPDGLPTDRRVCLAFDRVPVGAALESLLDGLPLRVMAVGATHVVLAPTRSLVRGDSLDFALRSSVLDRVVVTGAPEGAPQRATAFALEVIDGASLSAFGVTGLGQALELAVPGMWMWTSSPGAMTAQYASVRGASSFGASAPKVYLDGIEVANPLLVTQVDAARIDRIEVIRGPQGAALYGADAISGVISIITRVDGTPTGAPTVQLTSRAGLAETDFASSSALVQQYGASVRAGRGPRTGGAGISISNIGAYVPGASELRLLADGNSRFLLSKGMVTTTGRYSLQRGNAAIAPLRASLGDTIGRQSMSQYTVGTTASVMPNAVWTLTAIAGVDGFRVDGLSTASLPVPQSLQSAVQRASGGADRFSLRLRGTARHDVAERTTLTVTMAAEQAMLRDATDGTVVGVMNGTPTRVGLLQSRWARNSGVVVQGDVAWRDQLYLVAGGRLEQTVGATPAPQRAAMPMLGAAFVQDFADVTLKFRVGYGWGIRPAQSLLRSATWAGRAALDARFTLEPESQSGTEFGTDVHWGNRFSVHVTRFDQQATGLIQPVAVGVIPVTQRPGQPPMDTTRPRRIAYVLENVGAIDNRGWELEGNARFGQLTLTGWWSLVDSRVAQVATGYRGDLRAGDRTLDVPAQTMSVSASWTNGRFQSAWTLARAYDWIGYNRVGIATALATRERTLAEITGAQLRRFWYQYDDVTRLRAVMSWRVAGETSMQLGGENLLDIQRGAPDNATIVAGRTVTVGVTTKF